jgi:hypothetical protein
MKEKIDPELLQARWVLGGIRSDDLPDLAVSALQQGLDGTALRQLAGLVRPTLADLEDLPQRAFIDMGLTLMSRDHAVDVLMERGIPLANPILSTLLKSFPGFMPRWREHLACWAGETPGPYVDMAEFVHFVVEDLYEKDKHNELKLVFEFFERQLDGADEDTRSFLGVGFFETLQNFASWRPYGNRVFEGFLGVRSMQLWRDRKNLGREVQPGGRHPGGAQSLSIDGIR